MTLSSEKPQDLAAGLPDTLHRTAMLQRFAKLLKEKSGALVQWASEEKNQKHLRLDQLSGKSTSTQNTHWNVSESGCLPAQISKNSFALFHCCSRETQQQKDAAQVHHSSTFFSSQVSAEKIRKLPNLITYPVQLATASKVDEKSSPFPYSLLSTVTEHLLL